MSHAPRQFPSGPGGIELTYDADGREVGPGRRGAVPSLIGEGPHARVYRGRTGVGDVALKVRKEESPEPNPATEGRFGREFEALSRYGGEEPGLLAIEPVPGFTDADEPPTFEPLFLCRERGIFFPFPCPRCMRVHVLADCRDDDALAAANLPRWSTSGERFVWCSACGREDPFFYARTKRHSSPKLEDFTGLVRALRRVVDRGSDADPLAPELFAGLEQDFPCLTCEHRAACHPRPGSPGQGVAEARLVPFSMNEFQAWPLALCPLSFDEAADHLSGAPAGEIAERHGKDWKNPGTRRMKEDALAAAAPPEPLQAFAAKLDLFAQAVQSVHRLHAMSGEPHLAISPEHLLVDPGNGGTPLVRLAAPGGARRLKDLRLAPIAPRAPYAAPEMVDARFGREYSVRVNVTKIWTGDTGTFFTGVLRGDGLPVGDVADKDEILVALTDEGWRDVRIWCRPLSGAQARPDAGGLAFVSEPEILSAEQQGDLKHAKDQAPLFGKATIHRDFGIPFDLHALGMLLFRTFLVNGRQTFERVVEELVLPVSASIELFRRNRPEASPEEFRAAVAAFLKDPSFERLAAPANAWHKPDQVPPGRIPDDAWYDLLVTGFRAIVKTPGFGFVDSDRAVPADPGGPTGEMLSILDQIGERTAERLLAAPGGGSAGGAARGDDVLHARPLTERDLEEITGEVMTKMKAEVAALRAELAKSGGRGGGGREGLAAAWRELYQSVVGKPDPDEPPTSPEDGRIALLAATIEASIECITQVFKGIARLAGDELGDTVPKIRVIIQDALFETQGGRKDAASRAKKIKRELDALRMFLFAVVQTFLEANAHSTRFGTRHLLEQVEEKLFAPVSKGKRSRDPEIHEIRERFAALKGTLPENHQRIFQPFFQKYVQQKLKSLS